MLFGRKPLPRKKKKKDFPLKWYTGCSDNQLKHVPLSLSKREYNNFPNNIFLVFSIKS